MTRPHERIGLVTIIAMDDISRCCLLEVVVDVFAVGTEVVPVVGAEFVGDVLAGAVGVDVIRHVVSLVEHVLAHLVEGGGGDEVALAVDVPGDGAVRGADGVVAGGASGGASVSGDLLTHDAVGADSIGVGDDHTAEHIGVVVVLVVDNDEDLALDANLAGEGEGVGNPANRAEAKLALTRVGLLAEAAEDTVVEGVLVLPLGVASTHLGMGPVDLVGLADDHVLAVLPIVVLLLVGGEGGVLVAPAAEVGGATGCSEELAASGQAGVILRGGGAVIRVSGEFHAVLVDGCVLGAKMPVNVHGAHSSLGEGGGDGSVQCCLALLHVSALVVAERDVTAGLLDSHGDAGLDALKVVETGALAGLLAGAGVLVDGGSVVLIPLRLERRISNADCGGASDERADDGVAADSGGGGALLLGHDAKLGGDLNDGSHFD